LTLLELLTQFKKAKKKKKEKEKERRKKEELRLCPV
jgi:hypothetical protein